MPARWAWHRGCAKREQYPMATSSLAGRGIGIVVGKLSVAWRPVIDHGLLASSFTGGGQQPGKRGYIRKRKNKRAIGLRRIIGEGAH